MKKLKKHELTELLKEVRLNFGGFNSLEEFAGYQAPIPTSGGGITEITQAILIDSKKFGHVILTYQRGEAPNFLRFLDEVYQV